MSIQISLIGLGQIGASIGLALKDLKEEYFRTGHDREPEIIINAKKSGAIDRGEYNLPSAVENSSIIILAIPADEVRSTLEIIAPVLQPGALVLDCSSLARLPAQWAKELFPEDRYFIKFIPAISPFSPPSLDHKQVEARADLFAHSLTAITSLPETPDASLESATVMAEKIGSMPFFMGIDEIDGILAACDTLPQISAAALFEVVTQEAGWLEGRKIAARSFATATAPLLWLDERTRFGYVAQQKSVQVVRLLDRLITVLQTLREDVAAKDGAALQLSLQQTQTDRINWPDLRDQPGIPSQDQKAHPAPRPKQRTLLIQSLRRIIGLRDE